VKSHNYQSYKLRLKT